MSLQYDNRQLHRELTLKTESCLQLQQGYDQQTIVLRSAYREIEDLQEQVGHFHQLLVGGGGGGRGVQSPGREKAKVKKKRSSPAKHSLVHFSSSDSSSPLFNETGRSFHLFAGSPDSRPFSDTSAQLLAEARATFLRLENEAKELEKSYSLRKPQATSLFSAPASSSTLPYQIGITGLSSPIGTITATATRSLLFSESSPDTHFHSTGIKQPPRMTLTTPPLSNLVSVSHPTTVTTPTQHNATPLLSTGHHSLSDQSTQIISSDHTSPQEESGSLGPSPDIGPVRLDELWKKQEDTILTTTSPVPTSATNHMTIGHVTTTMTTGHVTTSQEIKAPPIEVESTKSKSKGLLKQEEPGYEDWQRQREEKRRLREEQEKADREREQQELRKLEEEEETEKESKEEGESAREDLHQEEEDNMRETLQDRGEEDVLAQYMKMVQQSSSRQTQLVEHHSDNVSDKELSIMLATKSISNNSQSVNGDTADTFEEW